MEELAKVEIVNKMKELAQIIGYSYKNISWLAKAMRAEKVSDKEHSNDALATVGDAVLKLVLADYFYKYERIQTKGEITDKKSKLENNEVLDRVLKDSKYNIINFAYHDRAFYMNDIKEDQVASSKKHTTYIEAIIGAMYYDRGIQYTKSWIISWLKPKLEEKAKEIEVEKL